MVVLQLTLWFSDFTARPSPNADQTPLSSLHPFTASFFNLCLISFSIPLSQQSQGLSEYKQMFSPFPSSVKPKISYEISLLSSPSLLILF